MSTQEFKQLIAKNCSLCDSDPNLLLLNYALHHYIKRDFEKSLRTLQRVDSSVSISFAKPNYKTTLFFEIQRQAALYN